VWAASPKIPVIGPITRTCLAGGRAIGDTQRRFEQASSPDSLGYDEDDPRPGRGAAPPCRAIGQAGLISVQLDAAIVMCLTAARGDSMAAFGLSGRN
jgi:hypothetical protein